MTTFIVLGSLFMVIDVFIYAVSIGTVVSSASNAVTATTAINQLNNDNITLSNSLTAEQQVQSSCDQNLTCVTKQDSKAATAFSVFSSQLEDTPVPSGANEARLSADAAMAARDYSLLSKATTVAQYQSTFNSVGLQQTLDGFDQDFTALINQLRTYE
jgi:hypothetical protein